MSQSMSTGGLVHFVLTELLGTYSLGAQWHTTCNGQLRWSLALSC
jgi:hypothetical protein